MKKILNHLKSDWYKYVLELIVIMAGILGAYTLNDWSDRSERKNTEVDILTEIKNHLQLDLLDLISNREAHESSLGMLDSLSNAGNYSLTNHQIAVYLHRGFRDYIFLPQTGAFETLKAKGVDLIKNDSLRLNILRVYDFHYNAIVQIEASYQPSEFTDDYKYILNQYMNKMDLDLESAELSQIETKYEGYDWLQNGDVQVRVGRTKLQRVFMLDMYDGVISKVNELIVQLNEELE